MPAASSPSRATHSIGITSAVGAICTKRGSCSKQFASQSRRYNETGKSHSLRNLGSVFERITMIGSAALLLVTLAVHGAEPPSYQPAKDELAQIRAKTENLAVNIAFLRDQEGADRDLLLNVEVYHKAAEWICATRSKSSIASATLPTRFRPGSRPSSPRNWPPTAQRGQSRRANSVRAYRSQIDDSVQPYALLIPANYDGEKPVRLDVVLHGRAMQQNEVNFIAAHDSGKPAPANLDHIQLERFWPRQQRLSLGRRD